MLKTVSNGAWVSSSLHPSYSRWLQKGNRDDTKILYMACKKALILATWVITTCSVITCKPCKESENTRNELRLNTFFRKFQQ